MVSPFEYVSVLISIILGMGIAQIVSGVTGIVQRWDSVRLYWPHSTLVALLFMIHIQDWWFLFNLRTLPSWRLQMFLFIILYPVNLYILSRIMFPLRWHRHNNDFRTFYFENCRRIYVFILTLFILAMLNNIFISGYPVKEQIPQLTVGMAAAIIVFTNTKKEWVHKFFVTLLLALSIAVMVLAWDKFIIHNG